MSCPGSGFLVLYLKSWILGPGPCVWNLNLRSRVLGPGSSIPDPGSSWVPVHSVLITKWDKKLLRSVTIITKSDRKLLQSVAGITNCDTKLLQSVTGTTKIEKKLLKSAAGIKSNNYYRVRRNTHSSPRPATTAVPRNKTNSDELE